LVQFQLFEGGCHVATTLSVASIAKYVSFNQISVDLNKARLTAFPGKLHRSIEELLMRDYSSLLLRKPRRKEKKETINIIILTIDILSVNTFKDLPHQLPHHQKIIR
jgi:hypothetical protein